MPSADKNELKFVAKLDTNDLIKAAKSAGKGVDKALSLKNQTTDKIINKQIGDLEKLQAQGEKTYNELKEQTLAWAKASGVKSTDKMVAHAKETPEFKSYVENLEQQGAKADSINQRYDNVTAKAQQAADAAQKQAEAEQRATEAAKDSANATEQQSKATQEATNNTKAFDETTKQAGQDAENALEGVKDGYNGVNESAKQAGKSAEEAIEQISKTPVDINADLSKMSILELVNHLQRLKDEMKALEKDAKASAPTQDQIERYNQLGIAYEKTKSEISSAKKEFKEMAKDAEEGETANRSFIDSFKEFSSVFTSMSQASGLLGRLKAGISALGTTSLFAGAEAQQALTMATGGINLVIEVVARLATIVQTVFNALKTLGSAILDAFKKVFDVIKKVGEAIKDNIIKLANKAKSSFADMFSFSGSDMKRTLQMLTKYIFGVRSFFFLYRKLRKAVGEGLENLVQFEGGANDTNVALTELKTSLLYLKNAWAAAFAPIINVVYPILVKFLDLLASVGNAIARFVAFLTGQETVLQAVRVSAGDYAESLAQAGGSAGKAADEQEKLNKKLAAFDDLNVLGIDEDTDPNKGRGGGGGGADDLLNPNEMFERIETPFNKFAELLKKAWETGDGFELGQYIADQLNQGLEKAHEWLTGEGRDKIYKIANLIGTTLDGVLSDDELAKNIGQVLADLFSDAMLFINTVITPERMYMVGVRFAEMLNTAIPQIVPELGKTIGNLFKSAIANAWGFISTADFAGWGIAVGDAINNFFNEMGTAKGILGGIEFTHTGWQLFGMSVSEFAQKILDFFINAINEVDWVQIGQAIGDFLGSIDVNSIKGGLAKLFDTIKTAFSELLDGLGIGGGNSGPWGKATSGNGGFLSTITSTVGVLIDMLPTLFASLKKIVDNIHWDSVQEFINNLPEMFERLLTVLEQLLEIAGPLVDTFTDNMDEAASHTGGLVDKIYDAVHAAEEWNESQNGGSRFEQWTGINFDPVDFSFGSMAGTGIDAALQSQGLPPFLSWAVGNGAEEVVNGAIDVADRVLGALDFIANGGKNSAEALMRSFKDVEENIKISGDKIKTNFDLTTVTDNIKGFVSTSTASLSEIPDKFTEMKGAADTQSTAIKGTYNTTFDNIKQGSIESAQVVQDNFLLASDNIKDSFLTAWDEIKKSMSEGGSLFMALSDGMGNTIKALLNGMIAGINVSITKPLQDISKSFNILRTLDVNGARPFAGIPYLNVPTIPALAQGAVIPPNNKFLAVLGDQTSGTNIEAPLDTIQQAVGAELAPYLQELIAVNRQVIQAINAKPVISKNDIGKANAQYVAQQKIIRGTML